MKHVVLALFLVAAAPVPGSEDYELLHPYADWVRSLRRGDISCCDMADGRPVQARTQGDHWQVKFRVGQLAGAPTEWTEVPANAVITIPNPTGVPIAFWWSGQIRCFIPANAI